MRADNREDAFQLIPVGMRTETRRRNQYTKWLAWYTNKCERTHSAKCSYNAAVKTNTCIWKNDMTDRLQTQTCHWDWTSVLISTHLAAVVDWGGSQPVVLSPTSPVSVWVSVGCESSLAQKDCHIFWKDGQDVCITSCLAAGTWKLPKAVRAQDSNVWHIRRSMKCHVTLLQ